MTRTVRIPYRADAPDWLLAVFAYCDRHGLLVGTRTLAALLGR